MSHTRNTVPTPVSNSKSADYFCQQRRSKIQHQELRKEQKYETKEHYRTATIWFSWMWCDRTGAYSQSGASSVENGGQRKIDRVLRYERKDQIAC